MGSGASKRRVVTGRVSESSPAFRRQNATDFYWDQESAVADSHKDSEVFSISEISSSKSKRGEVVQPTWTRELTETGRWVGLRVFIADDRLGARARAAEPPPAPGVSLAKKYVLGRKISDNPESELFESEDRKFSIKIFRNAPVAQILDVLEICEKIGNSSPKLLLPSDVFFASNRWVLVEPLADGNAWNFFKDISDQKTPELRSLLWSIVSALSTLHAQGIVHGNIRPEAFLRIGSSWVLGSLQHAFACTGNYRAPEILVNSGSICPGADFFALGISILEISAHKRWAPERASSEDLLNRALTVDVHKIFSDLKISDSADLVQAVETLLSLDPAKRTPEKTVQLSAEASEAAEARPKRPVRKPTKFVVPVDEDEEEEEEAN